MKVTFFLLRHFSGSVLIRLFKLWLAYNPADLDLDREFDRKTSQKREIKNEETLLVEESSLARHCTFSFHTSPAGDQTAESITASISVKFGYV